MAAPSFTFRDREIFMSYGLMTKITMIIQDVQLAQIMAIDTELRNQVLTEVLALRNYEGAIKEKVNLDNLTFDEVFDLTSWVTEHVNDFFLRSYQKHLETLKPFQEKFSDLAEAQKSMASKLSLNG